MNRINLGLWMMFSLCGCATSSPISHLRVASFNVSMEATNYAAQENPVTGNELSQHLGTGKHSQIQNIAEIIQRVRPDIILLNEFDYLASSNSDIQAFIENYLSISQNKAEPITYPYFYAAPVNTGVDSGLRFSTSGTTSGKKNDTFGFGFFPGHYGMLVLSKFPIQFEQIRTFQHFLWKDMPDNLLSTIKDENGQSYYTQQAQQILRLSSKSHWDIPIQVADQTVHVLASHPTPPVFDGPENRNGKRNHDEIRFWTDYLSGKEQSAYIYDDKGQFGGLKGGHFVIAGDLNASSVEGDGIKSGIRGLLGHLLVDDTNAPNSEGGLLHTPNSEHAPAHTAEWRMRADYVLPSRSLTIEDSGVFWPKQDDSLFHLIKDRKSSSDHRLVWVDIVVH